MCARKCAQNGAVGGARKTLPHGAPSGTGVCEASSGIGSMNPYRDVLGQLRREWQRVGRSSEAQVSVACLLESHPGDGFEGLIDLGDVVRALETTGGRSVLERARIVRILLEEAHDPLIRRALLQTLIPGIVSVCRQLRFGEGVIQDPGETVSTALGFANELIADWAGQSRQYGAPDILSALRGRLRRWILKEKFAAAYVTSSNGVEQPAAAASPLETRLVGYCGGEYDRLARLTYARVYGGQSLRELARVDHSAPHSLQAELRQFAIHFLL